MSQLYQKEPMLSMGSLCCATPGCSKSGTQCVDVTESVVLTPTAAVGTITTACQGNPSVTCVTNEEGTACTVTLTQRVCVSIPVTFGVSLVSGEPTILCANL